MNSRRLCATFVLPASLALAACSSSTAGSGHDSAGAASKQSTSSAPAGGTTSSTATTGTAKDGVGLAALLQAGVTNIKTAHIALEVTAAGKTITGSGDEKVRNGRAEAVQITETLPGGTGQIRLVLVDGKTYVKLPASLNKSGKPYVLVTANSSNPLVKALSASVGSSLSSASLDSIGQFAQAAESVKVVGKESVDGVPTTHYALVVNLAKLPTTYAGKGALAAQGITTLPVDLYIDGQGRSVRLTEKLTVSGQTVNTKVTISKYNQPVTITAPPANEVATK